jgi:hypothetical protein
VNQHRIGATSSWWPGQLAAAPRLIGPLDELLKSTDKAVPACGRPRFIARNDELQVFVDRSWFKVGVVDLHS